MKKCNVFSSLLFTAASFLLISCGDEDPTTPDAVACFDFSPAEDIYAGQEISFTNCSENASEFAWDFGDGQLSTEENPTHIYEESGEFTVTLVAGNETSAGQSDAIITVLPDAITANRWKYPEVWEDYCDIESQTISGYEYITFMANGNVLYELELTGNTYGCEGDEEIIGTWRRENGSYYWSPADETFELEITLEEENTRLCWTDDDGERACWNKE